MCMLSNYCTVIHFPSYYVIQLKYTCYYDTAFLVISHTFSMIDNNCIQNNYLNNLCILDKDIAGGKYFPATSPLLEGANLSDK